MKCEFDESNPLSPCVYCLRHGLGSTCKKFQSPSRQLQSNVNSIPNPPSETTEFRISDISAYYEQLYPTAPPEPIIAYVSKHVQNQQRQDAEEALEQAMAQVAAAQQSPYRQSTMVVPEQERYPPASSYAGQYPRGYARQSQEPMVDPALLENKPPATYYPPRRYGD